MPKCNILLAGHNKLKSFKGLKEDIVHVDLSHNQITDFKTCKKNINITSLNMSGNTLYDFKGMPLVRSIAFVDCKIKSFEGFLDDVTPYIPKYYISGGLPLNKYLFKELKYVDLDWPLEVLEFIKKIDPKLYDDIQ